ncbi:MAG: dephospho-CoA kinase [Vicingaceae bacterium]
MKKPLLVGLTGGIGSGKTTVAKVFKTLGVPIFNSDVVAKNIINNNKDVVTAIKAEFGNIYKNEILDNSKMANIVFNDKSALKKLNSIIHPKVAVQFKSWIEEHQNEPIIIKEAAILIESEAYKTMDKIILVTAPEDIRIKRVIKRDNSSQEKVQRRIFAQLSDEAKKEYANYIINNDDKELVIPQILKVYEALIAHK